MEKQKTSSKGIMLNYGLMLGLASILLSVANYSFGDLHEPHWSIQIIGLLVLGGFIILGIKKFKDSNEGFLSLVQALKTGLGIALIGALLSLVYTYVFVNYIETEFVSNQIVFETQKMIDQGQSDEQIEIATGFMENYMMFMVFAGIIIMNLFIGFIVSLIGGLVMKQSNEDVTSI